MVSGEKMQRNQVGADSQCSPKRADSDSFRSQMTPWERWHTIHNNQKSQNSDIIMNATVIFFFSCTFLSFLPSVIYRSLLLKVGNKTIDCADIVPGSLSAQQIFLTVTKFSRYFWCCSCPARVSFFSPFHYQRSLKLAESNMSWLYAS